MFFGGDELVVDRPIRRQGLGPGDLGRRLLCIGRVGCGAVRWDGDEDEENILLLD